MNTCWLKDYYGGKIENIKTIGDAEGNIQGLTIVTDKGVLNIKIKYTGQYEDITAELVLDDLVSSRELLKSCNKVL